MVYVVALALLGVGDHPVSAEKVVEEGNVFLGDLRVGTPLHVVPVRGERRLRVRREEAKARCTRDAAKHAKGRAKGHLLQNAVPFFSSTALKLSLFSISDSITHAQAAVVAICVA